MEKQTTTILQLAIGGLMALNATAQAQLLENLKPKKDSEKKDETPQVIKDLHKIFSDDTDAFSCHRPNVIKAIKALLPPELREQFKPQQARRPDIYNGEIWPVGSVVVPIKNIYGHNRIGKVQLHIKSQPEHVSFWEPAQSSTVIYEYADIKNENVRPATDEEIKTFFASIQMSHILKMINMGSAYIDPVIVDAINAGMNTPVVVAQ